MARPSKLTSKQVEEIQSRHAKGESLRTLAAVYGVGKSAISDAVKGNTEVSGRPILEKTLANQLALIEKRIESLPISGQVSVRSLANQLKGISDNLAQAAHSGSKTAARINAIAEKQSLRINEFGTIEENAIPLKNVMMMAQVANEAAKIPLNLLAANKEIIKGLNENPADDIPNGLGFLYGE